MDSKRQKVIYKALLLVSISAVSCQPRTEEEGSIASTHPELQEQLAEQSIATPISGSDTPALYERYRITTEEYRRSGQFAVTDMYSGAFAPLDESSHPDASTFRTAIRKALQDGVNFAGKYTVVSVGCGTGCQQHFVVDRETGEVLDKLQGSMGASFTPDSRLFILNPLDSSLNYAACPDCAPQAYEFRDGRFMKLPEPAP